MQQFKKRLL